MAALSLFRKFHFFHQHMWFHRFGEFSVGFAAQLVLGDVSEPFVRIKVAMMKLKCLLYLTALFTPLTGKGRCHVNAD